MLCIILTSTDPYFNLAVDEFLLKNRREEFLVLSVNDPSVIIGKHQVAHREADTGFVTGNMIPVIRRISGGGAVYQDEGNLNFSFIIQSTQGSQVDFRKYTLPVIQFLSTLGVEAKFEGKNDLKVDGLKVSGNAEHVYRQRVLHHGTLLFSSDLENIRASLRKDTSAYSTRAVSSNPSAVMNLGERIHGMTMNSFISTMYEYFTSLEGNTISKLLPDEIAVIEKLASLKYRTWEWNYSYGPEYKLEKEVFLQGGKYHLLLTVKDGIIRKCMLSGSSGMQEITRKLQGTRHMPEDIKKTLSHEGLGIPEQEIYNFF